MSLYFGFKVQATPPPHSHAGVGFLSPYYKLDQNRGVSGGWSFDRCVGVLLQAHLGLCLFSIFVLFLRNRLLIF
jgi:hypothetical protein